MSHGTAASVPEIAPTELREMLEEGRDVLVLDIRPAAAFDEWHVPGSRHVGGYEAFREGHGDPLAHLPLPDHMPLVTVCGSGRTSRIAAARLRERGLDGRSLQGGLRAWTFAWNTARVHLSSETEGSGPAEVIQLRRTGKGCLSYLVGSDGEALVIDPSLAPSVYEDEARKRGWRITGVLDTHVHADHLSRAAMLARATGATRYVPEPDPDRAQTVHTDRGQTDHMDREVTAAVRRLGEGDRVPVGRAALRILHTPGHTPESVTCRLSDDAAFTGDTLFTSAVGRPDLEASPEEARRKARRLHRSLRRLLDLPSGLLVLPGHASGPVPFDGKPVAARLDEVRRTVAGVDRPVDEFVRDILDRVPPAPSNHEEIVERNRRDRWPQGERAVVELEAGANRCAVG